MAAKPAAADRVVFFEQVDAHEDGSVFRPGSLADAEGIRAVSVSELCAAAVSESGVVHIWQPESTLEDEQGQSDERGLLAIGAVPTPVLTLQAVDHVALGWDHVLAVTTNHELFVWGVGGFGQLGLGDRTDRQKPELCLTGVLKAAAGFSFSVCINEHNELLSWGAAASGQLGHADRIRRLFPEPVVALQAPDSHIVDVACGESHTVAVGVAGAEGSADEVCVYSWGSADDGRLGRGDDETVQPAEVTSFRKHSAKWGRPVQLSCGVDHTLALTDAGNVLAWGHGHAGQLGLGDLDDRATPTRIKSFGKKRLGRSVSAGAFHSVAVSQDGALYCWGSGDALDPSGDSAKPRLVRSATRFTEAETLSPELTLAVSEARDPHVWTDPHQPPLRPPDEPPVAVSELDEVVDEQEAEDLVVSGEGGLGGLSSSPLNTIAEDEEPAPAPPAVATPMLPEQVFTLQGCWAQVALPARLVAVTTTSELRRLGRALRHWARAMHAESAEPEPEPEPNVHHDEVVARAAKCIKYLMHRQLAAGFRLWLLATRHAEMYMELSSAQTQADEAVAVNVELQKVLHLREKDSDRLTQRLLHSCLQSAHYKILHMTKDRAMWSSKRSFERWKNYALSKGKEAELRRGKLKLQATLNQVIAERQAIESHEANIRHSRVQFAAILSFYQWRAQIERAARIAEHGRFLHQRTDLENELRDLYGLLLQSSDVEREVLTASLRRGGEAATLVADTKASFQKYCISSGLQ